MDIKYARELYEKTKTTEPTLFLKFLSKYILFRIKLGLMREFSKGNIYNKKIFDFPVIFMLLSSEDNYRLAKLIHKKLKEFYPHIKFSYLCGQIYQKDCLLVTFKTNDVYYTEYENKLKAHLKNFDNKKKYIYDSLVEKEIKKIEKYIKKAIKKGYNVVNITRKYKEPYENVGYIATKKIAKKGFDIRIYPIGNMVENKYSIVVSGWAK